MENNNIEQPEKKSKKKLLIGLVIMLIVIGVIIQFGIAGAKFEKTDNAQIDGSIISIKSAVGGFVKNVYFTENQFVKKGDTLFTIESSEYEAKLLQAKALLESAKAQTGVTLSAEEAALQNEQTSALNSEVLKANWEAAKVRTHKAEREMKRFERLLAKSACTQQQFDLMQSEFKTATALELAANKQFAASMSQSSSVKSSALSQHGQVSIANALVMQRLAEYKIAEIQLGRTVVTAPFDGIVSKKSIEIGQLLQPGQPVCSAIESDKFWVTAIFKETQIGKIKIGQSVEIEVDAYKSAKFKGKVVSLGAATGAKFALIPPDNATGNYVKVTQRIPVRIKFDQIDKANLQFKPGMSVNVAISVQ